MCKLSETYNTALGGKVQAVKAAAIELELKDELQITLAAELREAFIWKAAGITVIDCDIGYDTEVLIDDYIASIMKDINHLISGLPPEEVNY